jgi:hypothetical protein
MVHAHYLQKEEIHESKFGGTTNNKYPQSSQQLQNVIHLL